MSILERIQAARKRFYENCDVTCDEWAETFESGLVFARHLVDCDPESQRLALQVVLWLEKASEPEAQKPLPSTCTHDVADNLESLLDRLRACDGIASDAAIITHDAAQTLAKEIDRLRGIIFADPEVSKVTYTPEDGIEVEVEHWACKHLCASLWKTFRQGKGINFVTCVIGDSQHDRSRGRMVVRGETSRKGSGTPGTLFCRSGLEETRSQAIHGRTGEA